MVTDQHFIQLLLKDTRFKLKSINISNISKMKENGSPQSYKGKSQNTN